MIKYYLFVTLALAAYSVFPDKAHIPDRNTDIATVVLRHHHEDLKRINEAIAGTVAGDQSKVNTLLAIAENKRVLMSVRVRAAECLADMYPEFLASQDEDAVLAGNSKTRIEELNAALLARAVMQAGIDKIAASEKALINLRKQEMGGKKHGKGM